MLATVTEAHADLHRARNAVFVEYDEAAARMNEARVLLGSGDDRYEAARETFLNTQATFRFAERVWRLALAGARYTTDEAENGETWGIEEMLAANIDDDDTCGALVLLGVGESTRGIVVVSRVS